MMGGLTEVQVRVMLAEQRPLRISRVVVQAGRVAIAMMIREMKLPRRQLTQVLSQGQVSR
ncbi:hypothetical protein PF008_g32229 [Phytophthora fragariae]|uniref:Uncharacterized protein n=1 Tax=Phytophthora fragariae TaxID=53985 RepID=A0A6G0Q0D4_9STRA|nr:hypothetical protein PF003_g33060 [Phytophthora fragariae]KAE9263990.1 hypothetical protein PF008_g32229 [Phytophthora fragariae]